MTPPADVSVILAARDAEATLAETLDSLVGQSLASWEALVVDDGSRDATRAIAERFAAGDERFRLLSTTGEGVSAARNRALEAAAAPWVLFLDADDWLTPDALARLHERAEGAPEVDIVHGGWQHVLPTGERLPEHAPARGELFPVLARTDPLAVHSCLQRRELVERLGGFDSSLATCEDWDLYQRAARMGARFASVGEVVALYRLRADSAMSNSRNVMRDARTVIERGHGRDDRVSEPDPLYADGVEAANLPAALWGTAVWLAGLDVGRGVSFDAALGVVAGVPEPSLDPELVAAAIADAVPRGALIAPPGLPAVWHRFEEPVDALLGAVEEATGADALAASARVALERLVLEAAAGPEPAVLGRVAALEVELAAPLADIEPPPGVDKLVLGLRYDGVRVGSAELPVFDGRVPAAVVADAAASAAAWNVLGRFLETTVYPAGATPGHHDEAGWLTFLRELWGDASAAEADFYRGPSGRGRASRALARVRRRVRGTRTHELELSVPLAPVRGPVDVRLQAGGVPLGMLEVSAPGRVEPTELRGLVTYALGMELLRATVREALVGRPPGAPPLRERLGERAGPVADPPAGSLVLGRRAPYELDSSAARRAALPAEAADELRALARACGEPVEDGAVGAPVAVSYAPERLPARGRGRAGRRAAADGPGGEPAGSVPILMYHRVAATGARAAARWRVTPDQLDEQLGLLASRGCRSISLERWHDAVRKRAPVPAGSVCITFDDAYVDFAEEAWPLLKRHGFGAHLFVVTGEVGGWNRWDADLGERVPLLGWDELAALRDDGVLIGAHSVSHPAMARLSPVEVVRQLARSRTDLRERLGVDARAFAYPYGDYDPSVAHLAGACGFRQAVTCRTRPSGRFDDPLELPRIEVAGTTSADDLAAALG